MTSDSALRLAVMVHNTTTIFVLNHCMFVNRLIDNDDIKQRKLKTWQQPKLRRGIKLRRASYWQVGPSRWR